MTDDGLIGGRDADAHGKQGQRVGVEKGEEERRAEREESKYIRVDKIIQGTQQSVKSRSTRQTHLENLAPVPYQGITPPST